MLALCRNIPQAHASLVAWRVGALELRGQRALRQDPGGDRIRPDRPAGRQAGARPSRWRWSPSTSSSPRNASASSGWSAPRPAEELYARADFLTIHLPKTPDTVNWIDAEAIAEDARRGPDRQLRPRRADRPRRAEAALESGKVAGAALDVFPEEPFTEHRSSSARTSSSPRTWAPRRPRPRTAPGRSPPSRSAAALTGGVVTNAVNIAAVRPEAMEALAPFVPLCEKLGRLAQGLGNGTIDRVTPSSGAGLPTTTRASSGSRCWSGSSRATPRSRSTSSTPRAWPRSGESS